ncbi:FAS1 domain-containing protein [Psidium guajava]|nr:FAS1 domain-containing protein [Psidium guajava]
MPRRGKCWMGNGLKRARGHQRWFAYPCPPRDGSAMENNLGFCIKMGKKQLPRAEHRGGER